MPILTKQELIAKIAEETGSSKAATSRFLDSLQNTVMNAVAEGKEVKLTGFAAFAPAIRSSRTIKNPQTGEDIEVPAVKVVKIRPLGVFRSLLKGE